MLPLITGHEITGTVVDAGDGVSNVGPGDRVALNTVLTCRTCRRCAAGEETMCPNMAVAGFALDGGLFSPSTCSGAPTRPSRSPSP